VERISDPLDSTRITLTEDMRSRLAQGHNRRPASRWRAASARATRRCWWSASATHSTAPAHPDRRYAIAPGAGSQPASTVLRPRLGNVDDHDVIVVIVERTAHFAASLEGRKKITVIGDHTEQTNRSLQSSTRCPRRIERPYRRYLAPRGAGRALHQAIKRTWAAAAAPRVIGGPR